MRSCAIGLSREVHFVAAVEVNPDIEVVEIAPSVGITQVVCRLMLLPSVVVDLKSIELTLRASPIDSSAVPLCEVDVQRSRA